jgi:hypothetical protein
LGINGLKITFPEFTIGLPSIQLPSFTRFRRGSHMRLDRAAAPYMENPYYGEALLARQLQQARIREAIEEEERAARERAARERNVGCVDQGGDRGVGDEPSCETRIRALQEQLQKLQDCLDGVRNELSANPRPPRPPADFPPNIRKVPPTDTTGSARPAGTIQRSTYEVAEPRYMLPVIEVRRLPAPISRTPPPRTPLLRRLPFVAEG